LMVIGILSCLAIIAISVMISAVMRSVFDLVTIGCFPFFILMFFSGGMFPIPTISLVTFGERSINVNDVLPTTHSITAFGKILNQGTGLGDIVFEMGAIVLLTVLFFAFGIWLFTRRHMMAK
jgi:ABC-2 type transport system permease protein